MYIWGSICVRGHIPSKWDKKSLFYEPFRKSSVMYDILQLLFLKKYSIYLWDLGLGWVSPIANYWPCNIKHNLFEQGIQLLNFSVCFFFNFGYELIWTKSSLADWAALFDYMHCDGIWAPWVFHLPLKSNWNTCTWIPIDGALLNILWFIK